MKRRLTLLAALCLVAMVAMAAKAPKYVFYFIGDGMGWGHIHIANEYLKTVKNQPDGLLMMQFPVVSTATTFSLNNRITDSAAAGTALATGSKTNNSMLGMTPDFRPVYSVAKELKDMGYGVGITTSVPIDDATPGAFYTHVRDRGMRYEIGKDLAKSGYDFFAGSILRGTKTDGKDNDLIPTIQQAGYKICRGMAELNANRLADKILLLNNDDHNSDLDYMVDHVEGYVTLKDITRAVIDHEMRVSPDKFFIMVEGGSIDHAGHSNDPGAAVQEIIHFDECLRMAYEFYLKHPKETLILVTADHNTGGFTLGTYNRGPRLDLLDLQSQSLSSFEDYCSGIRSKGEPVTWEWMRDELSKRFGLYGRIRVDQQEDAQIQEAFNNTFITKEGQDVQTLYKSFSTFVRAVFRTFSSHCGLGWTTYDHSGNTVPVFAIGVGSETFNGMNDNTDLPKKIRKICNIKQ